MDKWLTVLQTALPVFLALGLGMLCRQKKFLSREGIDSLKKVVLNITLPAVLVQAFATARYTSETALLPGLFFIVCCIMLLLGFGMVRIFGIKSRLASYLASGFEAGMLGYALFALLFPNVAISEFAILDLGQTLFVFTLYKILLSGKRDLKAIGRDMATTPILWAVLVGLLLGATGLYGKMQQWNVSRVFDGITDFVSAPTAMMILLTVGYDLVPKEIPWKQTIGLIFLRLAAAAAGLGIIVLLNRTVLGGRIFEGAAILMFLLPPPYVIPVFADEPSERVRISSALSALTLVTMILFALYSVLSAA